MHACMHACMHAFMGTTGQWRNALNFGTTKKRYDLNPKP